MHSDNIEQQMQFQLSLLRLVCREAPVSPSSAPAATEKIEAMVKRLPPPAGR